MKKLGLIILVIGLLVTAFAGFNYVTSEKVVEIGSVKMMANQHHTMDWSPYLGIGIIAIGFVTYLVGTKSKQL
jgi:hypothetical protein